MKLKGIFIVSITFLAGCGLHGYEGRDVRYAVSIDGTPAEIFSTHTGDFTAKWRWNVLRGYSSRSLDISTLPPGKHNIKVYLLDPGLVLQEIIVK